MGILDEIDRILAEANKEKIMESMSRVVEIAEMAERAARKGIGNELDQIDEDIQQKITETLARIVREETAKVFPNLIAAYIKAMCLAYDREVGTYPESEYEGLALLLFSENGTSNGSEVWARANQDRLNAWRGEVNKKEE